MKEIILTIILTIFFLTIIFFSEHVDLHRGVLRSPLIPKTFAIAHVTYREINDT